MLNPQRILPDKVSGELLDHLVDRFRVSPAG
jgi:hypothetical protein